MGDATNLLDYTITNGNIEISVPENTPDTTDAVIVVDVSGVPEAAVQ